LHHWFFSIWIYPSMDLDFFIPHNLTIWYNWYVLVMIEHLKKRLKLVALLDVVVRVLLTHFWTRCLLDLGLQLKYSLMKVQNFVGSSKSCVRRHWLIIAQFHKTILWRTCWLNGWCKWWSEVCKNMESKMAILEIGTYNYHDQLWGISLTNKRHFKFSTIFFTIWIWTQILASIWRDAMIIINLDDLNVQLQACE
jgi:hypothetical protein